MKIGQLVQELSPKNLFSDLVLYRVALMALLAGIWLNLLLLVVATRSIWNFEHRITRKKVIGGSHGKDPRCMSHSAGHPTVLAERQVVQVFEHAQLGGLVQLRNVRIVLA